MQLDRIQSPKPSVAMTAFLFAVATCIGWPAPAIADDDDPAVDDPAVVMRVEEDWEILIGTPDADNAGPQIINVISPTGDIKGQHAVLELNHQTFPTFYGGGLQLQMWTGDIVNQFSNSKSIALLDKPAETFTYTMSMRIADTALYVEVLNGIGNTWAEFGNNGRLVGKRISLVKSLNGYSHTLSAQKSRVSYGGNRVRKMLLKEVRTYDAAGELIQSQPVNLIVHQTEDAEITQ